MKEKTKEILKIILKILNELLFHFVNSKKDKKEE